MDETADLLRNNAGRILGEMLGGGTTGTEREGDSVGPYRLCELIGEGGFGEVWRAEQTEVVKREVALKVIKQGMDTEQVLKRFKQERQALSGLDHPGIAALLDAGVNAAGRPWFAMELVRGGENVVGWCARHQPTVDERLRLFVQVCEAVQYAHARGVLHRDLKPANVMVTQVDGRPTAKLIDFGIAKVMHGTSLEDLTLLTQVNQAVGTPVYMSPEQIDGGRDLDARSDVYALGALLYELLTGLPPFDLDRLASADFSALRRMILDTEPERPGMRLRRHEARYSTSPVPVRLAADLDWITLRALEKDRERRYPTAAALAADVRRYLEGQAVLAGPPDFAYRAGRWLRHRHRAIIAACAGAAATTGLIAALLHWTGDTQLPAPVAPAAPPMQLAADGSFTNSLSMKFVPVPDTNVMFCIHETRYRDFIAYLDKDFDPNRSWGPVNTPGVNPTAAASQNLPVARINWEGARDFCKWLSRKEGRAYRLPTDREWSCAVGIGKEEKWTPATTPENVFKNTTEYPWGSAWPPPQGAGNYRDLTRKDSIAENPGVCLEGYRDGFVTAAPVMSFNPNKLGLYDMGGNVMEWVADWADTGKTKRVLRGGSWDSPSNDYQRLLLSSTRTIVDYTRSDTQHPCQGFRVVLDLKPGTPAL